MDTISIPETLTDGSTELARVFREPNGRLFFAVRTDVLLTSSADPAVFGLLVADLAQHIANCLEGRVGTDAGLLTRAEIFDRIRDFAIAELQRPTSPVLRVSS